MTASLATVWRTSRNLLVLGVVCVIAYLVSAEYAATTSYRLASLRNQATQHSSNLAELSASMRNLQDLSSATLARELLDLPTNLDVSAVLMEVHNVAAQAGVKIQQFQFTPVGANNEQSSTARASTPGGNNAGFGGMLNAEGMKSYPVTVTVSGAINQVLNFISGLEQYTRFTSVQSATFQSTMSSKSSKVVTANVDFYTYTINSRVARK